MTDREESRARDAATRLALALSRLQARVKKESEGPREGLTPSQVAMLQRLEENGGMSVTELAAAEHVSQQAVTQRLALLAPTGYTSVARDPRDARRKLVTITGEGSQALGQIASAGTSWLADAFATQLSPDDVDVLERAAALMEHLASSDAK